MNTEVIAEMLRSLKLKGMATSFTDLMNLPINRRPGLDVAVSKMIEAENRIRNESRTAKFLRAAKLRYPAYIEDVECSVARNQPESTLTELADCSFVRRGENLIITGQTGCGKSYLACALGRQACLLGLRTEYYNLNRFMDTIAQSRLDGTFQKLLDKLNKVDLVIMDDYGLHEMTPDVRLAFLQILEERYELKSVIIASQLPIKKWYDYIGNETLADAIMDRLMNSSTHIELKGESMRKKRRK